MELVLGVLLILAIITLSKVSSLARRVDEVRNEQRTLKHLLSRGEQPAVPQPLYPPKPAPEPISMKKPATPEPVPEATQKAEEPKEAWAQPVPSEPEPTAPMPEEPKPSAGPPPLPPTPAPTVVTARTAAPARKAVATPAQPSPVAEVLGKIWEWILVGDQYRKKGVSVEFAVATTWLIRIGAIGMVAFAAYVLRWSIEEGLLGPSGRVGLCIVGGIAMLVLGYRMFGKQYHLLGQGLFGGALAILYYSMYAAGPQFSLIPIWVAFLMMILVTVTAGLLSVRVDSMLIAILGIIGGFSTPIMLSTGHPNFGVLYSYLLLLGTGILVLSHFKPWRLLNYLGFALTWMMVLGSLLRDYDDSYFPVVMTLMSLLFVLHSSIVYWHNVVKKIKVTVLEIIYLVANSGVFSLIAYVLIRETHDRPWPAVMTGALALFFISHVFLLAKLKKGDRTLLITLVALAGLFTTLTMPLVLEKESLTMSWALLAVMFLWLSGKVGSPFLRTLSYLVYLLVFGKLSWDMQRNYHDLRGTATGAFSGYLRDMADRLVTFGTCIASVFCAFFIERRRALSEACPGDADEEMFETPSSSLRTAFYWIALIILFIFLQLEVNEMFKYFMPWRLPMLTMIWCVMGAYFLMRYITTEDWKEMLAASFFLGFGTLKVFLQDLASWDLNSSGVYMVEYGPVYVLSRLMDFGIIFAMAMIVWQLLRRKTEETKMAALYGYGGLFILFMYTTLELNAFLYWKLPAFRPTGISVLWALYGVAFVAGGLWKNLRGLRIAGLALFAVVVAKVVFIDLSDRPVMYKVVVCFAVSVTMLIGGFAYLKAAPKLFGEEDQS